ncbi:MAG: chemotaxis protein CheA [bacterium]
MDVSKYKSLFLSETQELLQAMNDALLKLEQEPADQDAVNELFRNAHSIKGMAASMGYENIRDLAHALENLMDGFRKQATPPGSDAMDILFKGLDVLEETMQAIAEDREPSNKPEQVTEQIREFEAEKETAKEPAAEETAPKTGEAEPTRQEHEQETGKSASGQEARFIGLDFGKYKDMFVSESGEHLSTCRRKVAELKSAPQDHEALQEAHRNAHSIKGMAATMGYQKISDTAKSLEELIKSFMEKEETLTEAALDLMEKGVTVLEGMLRDVQEEKAHSDESAEFTKTLKQYTEERTPPPAREKEAASQKTAEPERKPPPQIELDFDEPLPGPAASDKSEKEKPQESAEEQTAPAEEEASRQAASDENSSELTEDTTAPETGPEKPSPPIELDFDSPMPGPAGRKEQPEAGETAPEQEAEQAPAEPETAPALTLRVTLDPSAAAPGVRAFVLIKRLQEIGRVVATRPSREEVKAGNFIKDPAGMVMEIDLDTAAGEDEIEKIMKSVADVKSYETKTPETHKEDAASQPQPAEPQAAEPAEAVVTEQGQIQSTYDPFAQSAGMPQTVRVKTTALDNFINSLGEMILVKSELREVAKKNPLPGLEDGVDRLESLISEFHDQVMSVRMMPLEGVVQRLPRVVRDLAKEEGKKVKFEIKGRDIELDRAILEQLNDPLIHLLRNSVSHGIEPPEEREKLGKDQTGKIELEAYRNRDLVLIEIRDDGRGMDPFVLKETAVEKGIISAEAAEGLSDEEAYQLIFSPGFSTAKKVGLIAGRGVGMDAVKNVTESVGGHLTLSSRSGKGSVFTLHLPRTIAVVNVLLVKVASEVFGIPIAKIMKTVEILPHQVRRSQNKLFYLDRQELVPMKALHRYLDLPEPDQQGREPIPALIVETQHRKVVLTVDELVGQEEAFIRPLGKPLQRISGLSGVTMLGDGSVVFVLDTMSLI